VEKLILIRHGQTDKNLNKSLHAANDVEALNETGRNQVESTALRLKEFSPVRIYSSKEKRAIETAEILAQSISAPLEEVDGMQERNWGVFTDKSWEEVEKVLSTMTLQERYEYVPEEGESWKTFETRLINAINRIIEGNKGSSVAVVTHGGAIRALMPYLLNVPKEESFNYDPENASFSVFEISNHGFEAVMINDTSHLDRK
jgi:broad specificity phosphatase PhoE